MAPFNRVRQSQCKLHLGVAVTATVALDPPPLFPSLIVSPITPRPHRFPVSFTLMASSGPVDSRLSRVKTNNHPGQIVNDQKQKRRTPAEIRRDKEALAAKKASEQTAQMEEHKAKVAQTARLEEEHQRISIDDQQFQNRPDLRPASVKAAAVSLSIV